MKANLIDNELITGAVRERCGVWRKIHGASDKQQINLFAQIIIPFRNNNGIDSSDLTERCWAGRSRALQLAPLLSPIPKPPRPSPEAAQVEQP